MPEIPHVPSLEEMENTSLDCEPLNLLREPPSAGPVFKPSESGTESRTPSLLSWDSGELSSVAPNSLEVEDTSSDEITGVGPDVSTAPSADG